MFLNPLHFNAFLNKIGQDCAWRRAFACPCRNPDSGAARVDCARCRGKGYTWAAAVTGTAAPAGQKVQIAWAGMGLYEPGDVVLSIGSDSPLYAMGKFDRVMLLNDSQGFSQTLTRGVDDALSSPPVSIDRVYWLDDDELEQEADIPTWDADNVLAWAGGDDAPPTGRQYSVSGVRHTEYFAWSDFPSDRPFHHGAALPKKAVLRRFDLFGRS